MLALMALIAVVLTAALASSPTAAAYPQVPDSGAQRMLMIEELRTANRQLAEVVALLREIKAAGKQAPATEVRPAELPKKSP